MFLQYIRYKTQVFYKKECLIQIFYANVIFHIKIQNKVMKQTVPVMMIILTV